MKKQIEKLLTREVTIRLLGLKSGIDFGVACLLAEDAVEEHLQRKDNDTLFRLRDYDGNYYGNCKETIDEIVNEITSTLIKKDNRKES